MIKVVYLKPGEKPPADQRWVLIECKRGLRGDQIIQNPSGLTLRITPGDLDSTLDGLRLKAQGTAVTTVYVRQPVDAQRTKKPRSAPRT